MVDAARLEEEEDRPDDATDGGGFAACCPTRTLPLEPDGVRNLPLAPITILLRPGDPPRRPVLWVRLPGVSWPAATDGDATSDPERIASDLLKE